MYIDNIVFFYYFKVTLSALVMKLPEMPLCTLEVFF